MRIQAMGREPFALTTDGCLIIDPIGTDWHDIGQKLPHICKHEGEVCVGCLPDWRREFYLRIVQENGAIDRIGTDRLPLETPTGISL